jgi:Holliday junction resolvasome RuvABC endonuclease subunit
MLNCEKASTMASAALDRKLTVAEFIGLWIHHAVCGPCRAYRKQLHAMRRYAQRLREERTAGPRIDSAAKDRIRARLREKQAPSAND